MTMRFAPASWGPDAKPAALSITFDNFGEAAHLEMGMWGDKPVGTHHTAAFVPDLISALEDVRATYFIEASNVALYPSEISRWAAAGHEVAIHAWRHEVWELCQPAERRRLLAQSIAAMRTLGIEPVGFRPPGGAIPHEAWAEFAEAGLLYCSQLGGPGIERIAGVLSVPFAWHAVDVYMVEDVMTAVRQRNGDRAAPCTLGEWCTVLETLVDDALAEGGHRTVIFHPEFLALSPEKLDVVRHLIAVARRKDLWIAPARDVARFAADTMTDAVLEAA